MGTPTIPEVLAAIPPGPHQLDGYKTIHPQRVPEERRDEAEAWVREHGKVLDLPAVKLKETTGGGDPRGGWRSQAQDPLWLAPDHLLPQV